MTQLYDYQQAAIDAIFEALGRGVRRQLLVAATGAGKCLGKGTPVLMFDGTIKPVEEIAAGELLMGPDSTPRRVLSTTKGLGPLYRVTPVKGDSYIVNDAHILSLVISGIKAVAGFEPGSVVNMSVTEYLAQGSHFKHCAKGWRTGVDWPDREVLIDPYWLGLWLGDGSSRSATIYKPDAEVARYTRDYAARLGLRYVIVEAEGDKCPGHAISSQGGRNQNPLLTALRSYDLLLNKHIPLEYIANSRDVRVRLMAGLIDSDGHATHGGIDFVFSSERLASDVAKLARSLGLAAYLKPCRKTCANNGKVGDYFRISVSGDLSEYPVRIPRKQSPPRQQTKDVLRTGIKVTPEGYGDYYGFEIDGDRLFLLGDFTVTHNTIIFAYLVNQYLARGARVLVLAHRDRLIRQAADKIGKFVPWPQIGIVMADQNRLHAPCVIASVQTLARQRRLAVMPQFDLVIVDECHRSAAKTYQRILAHVCDSDTLLLGVTATPSRYDGIGLDQVYHETVYQVGILDLIERGYLVPLRGQRITLNADFSKLKTQKNADGVNDYKADEVAEIMDKANWYEKAAEGWFKYAADRRTLAFTPRVAMAHQFAEYMRGQGVRAIALDGSTPQSIQRQALTKFEGGEIQFLASCDLLYEGVDLPSANCALLARPTKSLTVYGQTVGRITRLSPETGKIDGLVLDMVGSTKRFDLLTLGDLFGFRELKDSESVLEAKEREEKEDLEATAEQLELPDVAEGEVVAQDVNLFEPKTPIGKPPFEWEIDTEAKRSKLKAAGHTFEIWREGGTAWYSFADMHWQGFIQGRTMDYREARAKIEAEARQLIYGSWANDPASDKQIKLLTKNKIGFRPNITKAEAKELLQPIFDKIERAKKARAMA